MVAAPVLSVTVTKVSENETSETVQIAITCGVGDMAQTELLVNGIRLYNIVKLPNQTTSFNYTMPKDEVPRWFCAV